MTDTLSVEPKPEGQPATYRPFRISNDAIDDAAELRRRLEEDSYLFMRRLVDEEPILRVRRDLLKHCRDAGWLDPTADLMEGIVLPGIQPTSEGRPEYMAVYKNVLHTPSFCDLPYHPALMRLAGGLLRGEVLVHPRRIGRLVFPNNLVATTPPHQDHFYIRGTVETYSVWMPLGECPVELGGLAILRGSHRAGFVEHHVFSPGAVGGRGIDPVGDFGSLTTDWRTIDFEPGDVLLFHAYTVHKALPNRTRDRLRLSTDNRYQRKGDEIHPSALGSHFDL